MVKFIALVLTLLLVALVAVVATRPDTFHIERRARIAAPPERIFALINDLRAWGRWSPWEQIDPAMQRTYGGPPAGVGAVYEWRGNGDVGSGRMEITQASPPSHVVIRLDFLEPFEAHNTAELSLQPTGDATTVTWAMYGPNTLLGKVLGLFLDVETMIGGQFEAGLANLKRATEQ
jgi:uncharacterized protein YndB with AHSA1/START domain